MSGFGVTGFGTDNSTDASLDYVRDAFADVTKAADSNAGLTDNANTNPLGQYFGNDVAPRYGAKALFIKSITLIEDKSKWIESQPTYEVNWTENFPSAKAYCFGPVSLSQNRNYKWLSFELSTTVKGFGVGGVIRSVRWLVGLCAGALTEKVDGSSVGTFGNILFPMQDIASVPKLPFSPLSSISTNQTFDLHDFRIESDATLEGLSVYGAIVYFENASANIQTVSGDVYLDKNKISVVGSSLAIPSPASMRGGYASVTVQPTSLFQAAQGVIPNVASACNGLINTNLINVSAGTGASFPPGTFIYAQQGATHYIGNVLSRSTDVLTMGVTLPFALSGTTALPILSAGPTFTISQGASGAYEELFTWRPADYGNVYNTAFYNQAGTSGALASFYDDDPSLRWRVWGASCWLNNPGGATFEIRVQDGSLFQVDGQFSALEMEFRTSASAPAIGCTFVVNGIAAFNLTESPGTGVHKRTVFANAGPGFNSVRIQPGTSMLANVASVTGYRYKISTDPASFYTPGGLLQGQTFLQRNSQTAASSAFGPVRRRYADQIPINTGWGATFFMGAAGGARILCDNNTQTGAFNFYGLAFAFVGTKGATFTCLLDGVPQNFSFGQWVGLGSSTAFHTLSFQGENGQTTIIEAIDILNPAPQMENLQQFTNPYYQQDPDIFKVKNKSVTIREGGIKRNHLDPYAAVFSDYFGHTFFGTSLGQTSIANTSLTITTHGGPVMLWTGWIPTDANVPELGALSSAGANDRTFVIRYNRDNTGFRSLVNFPILGDDQTVAGTSNDKLDWPVVIDPAPPPGVHTYNIGILKTGASTIVIGSGRLFAREMF